MPFDASGLVGSSCGDGELLALVLHGGPGLSDYTQDMAEEVLHGGDGKLRVARYQQRGQAPSTLDGPLTVAQQVADALSVMDHFEADTALVAGHSWGGHLAMHIAAAAPERVNALLLVDSLGAIGDGGSGTMGRVISERIGESGAAAMAALAVEQGLAPGEAARRHLGLMWPGYFRDPEQAPPMPPIEVSAAVNESVMADASALLAAGMLEHALPSIAVPAVHVIAAFSPIDPEANRRTAALMPNAIVEVLDTGHFVWMEQPGALVACTRRLLSAVSSVA